MKFLVSNTERCHSESPCKGAKRELIEYWDERPCTEEKFNERYGENSWLDNGRNHSVSINSDGKISINRQLSNQSVWTIDFETLEDLMKFIKEETGGVDIYSEPVNYTGTKLPEICVTDREWTIDIIPITKHREQRLSDLRNACKACELEERNVPSEWISEIQTLESWLQ